MLLFLAAPGLRRALVCRGCGLRVACDSDRIGEPSRHTNPLGIECEVLRFSEAENLEASEFRTAEHTWFPGYAWRPVACAGCGRHLGWRYEAVEPAGDPPVFYGLLTSALAREA